MIAYFFKFFLVQFSQRFIRSFAHHDNWHNLAAKQGNLGYGWLHYALIRNLKPTRALCIGSKYGFIPAICALACKHNQQGTVDFVDAGFDINDPNDQAAGRHWGGVGFWSTSQGQEQFNKFGLRKYIQLHVMTTQDFFQKYSCRQWQYVHIDGDHSYQGVKFDFQQIWPRLEKGGFIAIHDIRTPDADGNRYGTRKFWQELKASSKYNTFELPGLCGLGFIQK